MMRIYYPKEHYDLQQRGALFPLLKAFIKASSFTDTQRMALYQLHSKDCTFVEFIEEAELVILPMSWNYYKKYKRMPQALKLLRAAQELNLEVWSWNAGDFGVKLPTFPHLSVFRMSGYASQQGLGHRGMPVFIADRFHESFGSSQSLYLNYTPLPQVGFCGQAIANRKQAFKELIKIGLRNSLSRLGLKADEPQALLSASHLRAQLLANLQQHPGVNCDFIVREQYRAGAKTTAEKEESTRAFYQNIRDNAYVLCVRGAGNFSVRFYECLMMGRIPIYVHTDSLLPLNDSIDWKKHLVWVDYAERAQLAEKLIAFHQALRPEEFVALQQSNRQLWESQLRMGGFFKQEYQKL